MTGKEVSNYINLVARKVHILEQCGIVWKPEYGKELEEINKQLALLHPLVDQEHRRRESAKCSQQQKQY